MNEERNNFREEDIVGAVNKFKRSLISGRKKYFDVSEFEGIVEQRLDEGDIQSSEIAAKQGIHIHPNAIPLQLKYAQILVLYIAWLLTLCILVELDWQLYKIHDHERTLDR